MVLSTILRVKQTIRNQLYGTIIFTRDEYDLTDEHLVTNLNNYLQMVNWECDSAFPGRKQSI